MLKINPAISAIEEETAFTVLDRANALKAKGHPVINLGIGQPDFTPPRHILEAAEKLFVSTAHTDADVEQTLAAFRGKGIGSAMMTFALNRAKSLGYRTAD